MNADKNIRTISSKIKIPNPFIDKEIIPRTSNIVIEKIITRLIIGIINHPPKPFIFLVG